MMTIAVRSFVLLTKPPLNDGRLLVFFVLLGAFSGFVLDSSDAVWMCAVFIEPFWSFFFGWTGNINKNLRVLFGGVLWYFWNLMGNSVTIISFWILNYLRVWYGCNINHKCIFLMEDESVFHLNLISLFYL